MTDFDFARGFRRRFGGNLNGATAQWIHFICQNNGDIISRTHRP
jgi:hypothetical protein